MTMTPDELAAMKAATYQIADNEKARKAYIDYTKNFTDLRLAYVSFGEDYARTLQLRMQAGQQLKDIAENTITDVDDATESNISGNIYHNACQFLVYTWEHGPELYQWHQEKFGALAKLTPPLV